MLNRHNLNIAKLASKEGSRFTLNAIFVTQTDTVETDGSQLVVVSRPKMGDTTEVPEDYPDQPVETHAAFLLPASDAAKIQGALKNGNNAEICASETQGDSRIVPVVTADNDSAQTHRVRVPSGNFPDYQRVIPPASKNTFKITLNAKLVKDLMAQFETFTKTQMNPAVEFYFFGETNSVRMDADGGNDQHMTAVLMPMKGDFLQAKREAE